MKKIKLIPFQDGPFSQIEVQVELAVESLVLKYQIDDCSNILLPAHKQNGDQKDNLWQHTCFEVFIMYNDGHYHEFNMSPSHEWNHYYFSEYRKREELSTTIRPTISTKSNKHSFELTASINLALLQQKPTSINIATVIETMSNQIYYYSCKHQGDKADFHHPKNFILKFDEI